MYSPVRFKWSKPKQGFELVKGVPIGQIVEEGTRDLYRPVSHAPGEWDFLVPKSPVIVSYQPMEDPGLFRRFCLIEPKDEQSILEFAKDFGTLGIPSPVKANGRETWGELMSIWTNEIRAMRDAWAIWEALSTKDEKALAGLIQWRNRPSRFGNAPELEPYFTFTGEHSMFGVDSSGDDLTIVSRGELGIPDTLSRVDEGDSVGAAAAALNVIINRKLVEFGVTPQLHIRKTGREYTSAVLINPKNLISAMWIQLAYVVEEKKNLFRCEGCTKWIEGGAPGTSRADKRFCSPSCKARAHRRKQQRARELKLSGIALPEIAKELETTVKTVKGWIK